MIVGWIITFGRVIYFFLHFFFSKTTWLLQILELSEESSGGGGISSPMKPTGSAAFLHAIRNYRPSHKIRSLVALHPEGYFQTNFHDPYYLHAGLGK